MPLFSRIKILPYKKLWVQTPMVKGIHPDYSPSYFAYFSFSLQTAQNLPKISKINGYETSKYRFNKFYILKSRI